MQNRKWILTSLVMTFFGIPILAQFLAAVIAMLGVGLAGNDSNLLIVFYVQIMPDDFVMQLHRF